MLIVKEKRILLRVIYVVDIFTHFYLCYRWTTVFFLREFDHEAIQTFEQIISSSRKYNLFTFRMTMKSYLISSSYPHMGYINKTVTNDLWYESEYWFSRFFKNLWITLSTANFYKNPFESQVKQYSPWAAVNWWKTVTLWTPDIFRMLISVNDIDILRTILRNRLLKTTYCSSTDIVYGPFWIAFSEIHHNKFIEYVQWYNECDILAYQRWMDSWNVKENLL